MTVRHERDTPVDDSEGMGTVGEGAPPWWFWLGLALIAVVALVIGGAIPW